MRVPSFMLERILIPLDGSPTAESILPQVRRLVLNRRSEFILLRVLQPFPADFHLGLPESKEAEQYVQKLVRELVRQGLQARGGVRVGSPAGTLLDSARTERASVIALSTHARSGVSRWVLGSVAEDLMKHSPIPLLLLRAAAPVEAAPLTPFRNILMPTDGSPASLAILPRLRDFARPLDARITLLTVYPPGPVQGSWPMEAAAVKAAEQALREACLVTAFRERQGNPSEEILKEAAEGATDLIAMSTHGRSGPSRWILGSVTSEVLHRAPLPLMVLSAHPSP